MKMLSVLYLGPPFDGSECFMTPSKNKVRVKVLAKVKVMVQFHQGKIKVKD